MTNYRLVATVVSIPTITAIFGLLWLWDKRKKKKQLTHYDNSAVSEAPNKDSNSLSDGSSNVCEPQSQPLNNGTNNIAVISGNEHEGEVEKKEGEEEEEESKKQCVIIGKDWIEKINSSFLNNGFKDNVHFEPNHQQVGKNASQGPEGLINDCSEIDSKIVASFSNLNSQGLEAQSGSTDVLISSIPNLEEKPHLEDLLFEGQNSEGKNSWESEIVESRGKEEPETKDSISGGENELFVPEDLKASPETFADDVEESSSKNDSVDSLENLSDTIGYEEDEQLPLKGEKTLEVVSGESTSEGESSNQCELLTNKSNGFKNEKSNLLLDTFGKNLKAESNGTGEILVSEVENGHCQESLPSERVSESESINLDLNPLNGNYEEKEQLSPKLKNGTCSQILSSNEYDTAFDLSVDEYDDHDQRETDSNESSSDSIKIPSKPIDVISAMFSGGQLDDSQFKADLLHLEAQATKMSSTPNHATCEKLLSHAKQLFHETGSITPPETDSDTYLSSKEIMSETLESDQTDLSLTPNASNQSDEDNESLLPLPSPLQTNKQECHLDSMSNKLPSREQIQKDTENDSTNVGGQHEVEDMENDSTNVGGQHEVEDMENDSTNVGGQHVIEEDTENDSTNVGGQHGVEDMENDSTNVDGQHVIEEDTENDSMNLGGQHGVKEDTENDSTNLGGQHGVKEDTENDSTNVDGQHVIEEDTENDSMNLGGQHGVKKAISKSETPNTEELFEKNEPSPILEKCSTSDLSIAKDNLEQVDNNLDSNSENSKSILTTAKNVTVCSPDNTVVADSSDLNNTNKNASQDLKTYLENEPNRTLKNNNPSFETLAVSQAVQKATNDENITNVQDSTQEKNTNNNSYSNQENSQFHSNSSVIKTESGPPKISPPKEQRKPDSVFSTNCDAKITKLSDVNKMAVKTKSSTLYEFYFPSELCGRLIGRQGKNIIHIKERSGASVSLQLSPFTPNHQICSIEGSQEEIDEALKCIGQKFPNSIFPNVDLTAITDSTQLASSPVVVPNLIQLSLPPQGLSIDVLVASIVDGGHLFLQLPTHPTYAALERLNQFMNRCYSQPGLVPQLPRPLAVGVICAAPVMEGWYRAVIVAVCEETDECEIKFVDYGGFSRVPGNLLRQIRSDFMTLPFQAIEAYLANITPLQNESYFSDRAVEILQELTENGMLQAQVVSRAEDDTPYVHIYQISGNKVTFVNRELVNRGAVRWIEVL